VTLVIVDVVGLHEDERCIPCVKKISLIFEMMQRGSAFWYALDYRKYKNEFKW